MNRLIVDTSAYIWYRKASAKVVAAIDGAERVLVSPIMIGEIVGGILGGSRLVENAANLDGFLSSPRVEVVSIDEETSRKYATIWAALRRAGTPISQNDMWIAASAMQYGCRLLTTDKDFQRVPQIEVELVL